MLSSYRRLNTNSGNSGIPYSKDPPWYTDNQGNAGTQTGDGGSSPATMGGTENKENDTESGTSREKAPKDSLNFPKITTQGPVDGFTGRE